MREGQKKRKWLEPEQEAALCIAGVRRLSISVIKQAHTDLASPCRKFRIEGVEFFNGTPNKWKPSPWLGVAEINPDFARNRIRKLLTDAETDLHCHGLKKQKRGLTCPHCKIVFKKRKDEQKKSFQ